MSSQIAPRDSCIISLCDNPLSISAQTVTNERSLEEAGQRQKNATEENLTAIDDLYRPVLKVMKLSGAYFGATSLANAVNSSRPRCHLSQLYCAIVAAGLWFDFVMPVVSAILGDNIYLHIMFISWCLLVALLGTTCLIVLPSTATRTSRFETFIRKVISLDIERPYLEKVKSRLKIHAVQKILPKMPAAAEEEGKVLLLMMDLQGEPRGLSIGGLSVITKSLSISIVGVIISYVAVILSLPS
ncbi:uncharacterized protein [Montipora foliosa]|uniref:uncharacterized protein isoform X2 n=1 Tax=Montipora foliosa TaxID=591990 RepID=UPI0035F11FCC